MNVKNKLEVIKDNPFKSIEPSFEQTLVFSSLNSSELCVI